MPTLALDKKQFINDYFEALHTQPKTEELMDRYISDHHLKQHILEADSAFPGHSLSQLTAWPTPENAVKPPASSTPSKQER